jgi:hypothetical protein
MRIFSANQDYENRLIQERKISIKCRNGHEIERIKSEDSLLFPSPPDFIPYLSFSYIGSPLQKCNIIGGCVQSSLFAPSYVDWGCNQCKYYYCQSCYNAIHTISCDIRQILPIDKGKEEGSAIENILKQIRCVYPHHILQGARAYREVCEKILRGQRVEKRDQLHCFSSFLSGWSGIVDIIMKTGATFYSFLVDYINSI